jgi:hypothetical protein
MESCGIIFASLPTLFSFPTKSPLIPLLPKGDFGRREKFPLFEKEGQGEICDPHEVSESVLNYWNGWNGLNEV